MSIKDIHDCYGCGVCAIICGRKIIEINLNKDGFYEPQIVDETRCTDCGLCVDVCAYSHDEPSLQSKKIHSYAAWSLDSDIRRKSSSGGIGFELGKTLISSGYKVCGVRYNVDAERAEHFIASTVKELMPSIGSKYIQSYTVDGFKMIDRNGKYLVTGTPCQIDSFRRYIRKVNREKNFVLLDFFCHGVPSMFVWRKYLREVEVSTGKVTHASWRNKLVINSDSRDLTLDVEQICEKISWHDSWCILIKGRDTYHVSHYSQGDAFYNLFLSDTCLGKACYEKCKYKYDHSSADIRIGDLWGKKYKNDEMGVSAVVAFTDKGEQLLKRCNCELVEHPFVIVAEGQMKNKVRKNALYEKIATMLKDPDCDIERINSFLLSKQKWSRMMRRLRHPQRTIVNIIMKLVKK